MSLDNGKHVVQSSLTVINVTNNVVHNVTFIRKGKDYELQLDGMYSIRGVVSGEDDMINMADNDIYVGGDPSLENGYTGCLHGIKIDNKDMPTSDSNEYFIATPSEGGAVKSCGETTPKTSDGILEIFDTLYILGGVVLGLLLIIAIVFVLVSKCSHHCYRKRRDKLEIRSRRDPIFSPVNPIAINRTSLRQSISLRGMESNFLQRTNSFEHFAVSDSSTSDLSHAHQAGVTPSPIQTPPPDEEHPINEPLINNQLRQPTRSSPVKVMVPKMPKSRTKRPRETINHEHSRNPKPSHVGLNPKPSHNSQDPKLSRASLDPMTGMPLQELSRNETTSTLMSPIDARNYIMGKVRKTNDEVLDNINYDDMKIFNDEGDYVSLGSFGSLYDILDDGNGEEFEITKMELERQLEAIECTPKLTKHTPLVTSPLMTTLTTSPVKHHVGNNSSSNKPQVSNNPSNPPPKILKRTVRSKRRLQAENLQLTEQLKDRTNKQLNKPPITSKPSAYYAESEFL